MTKTFEIYHRVSKLPAGERIFSKLYARKAPYFKTIRPKVTAMEPHFASLTLPKRKSVENHIGTVHAIAVCNGLEAAMGLLAEATVPEGMRWLPKSMQVNYLAKGTTDLVCTAQTTAADWEQAPEVPVKVKATRSDGTIVVEGVIGLWVTPYAK